MRKNVNNEIYIMYEERFPRKEKLKNEQRNLKIEN